MSLLTTITPVETVLGRPCTVGTGGFIRVVPIIDSRVWALAQAVAQADGSRCATWPIAFRVRFARQCVISR
jgi:hypothetical protein